MTMNSQDVQIEGRKKMATIHDVANLAGVAVGTVSRYLNGQDVRRGNRNQIEQAIEHLSFQRSAVARAMKADKTHIIGFMVPTFDEFHADLLDHLARLFRQTGRTMLTYCHDGDPKILQEAITFFANQRVDTLVMAGYIDAADEIRKLTERQIPVIIYNNDVGGVEADKIFVENQQASHRAVRHLLDVGHRKIATAHGRIEESSAAQRLAGYRQALEESGIPLRQEYIYAGGWTREGGYSAIQQFMALAEPPTAIFSANYRMTTGILEWVREHGGSVPGDISIVSFDDVELFRLYDQGITAVAQPIAKIAEMIVSYATSRLSETNLPEIRTRSLDCSIMLRGSSRLGIAAK